MLQKADIHHNLYQLLFDNFKYHVSIFRLAFEEIYRYRDFPGWAYVG